MNSSTERPGSTIPASPAPVDEDEEAVGAADSDKPARDPRDEAGYASRRPTSEEALHPPGRA